MNFNVTGLGVTLDQVDEAISGVVNNPHREDFREIGIWLIKSGLGQQGARERLIKELSERVSKEITNGIVQLTVLELEEDVKKLQMNIEKDLPPFYPNVQFVVKSGAIDIDTLTYWFRVTGKVAIENLNVLEKNREIIGFSSGSMKATLTLAFCGRNRDNENPLVLIDKRPIMNIDLDKAVEFVRARAA